MTDTCGAIKKDGTPCRQKAIYANGRCKFHGGLSTGPTTEAGKEQSRINGRKGGRPCKDGAPKKTEVMATCDHPKITPRSEQIASLHQEGELLKDVKVWSRCERCANFAGGGRCLAVSRGVIPSMQTGDTCGAFSPF